MHCFYHTDVSAVAICKSCNRGLCQECATPIGNGIACAGSCEGDVAALNLVLARNVHANSKGSFAWSMTAGLYLVMGAVFGIWGWTSEMHPITILGAALFASGVFLAIRGRGIVRAG